MQMDGRLDTLLSVLSEEEYVNLDTAAKKLQISQRTARTLVSQLGELLERHGAAIERRRGHGIRIMVRDNRAAPGNGKAENRVYPGPVFLLILLCKGRRVV